VVFEVFESLDFSARQPIDLRPNGVDRGEGLGERLIGDGASAPSTCQVG